MEAKDYPTFVIFGRRGTSKDDKTTVKDPDQVYMDQEELRLTELCHIPSIKLFDELLVRLPTMHFNRAIELGCGDGRFTADALVKKFVVVDLVDLA